MSLVVMVMLGSCTTAANQTSAQKSPATDSALNSAANRFLTNYVTSDGRVIRRDQGGDIVSEGQAYGMLIAESINRPSVARTIWTWTKRHLGRSDGLFAWHATSDGQIEDSQSAADADILIAFALLRYQGPGGTSLHAAGKRVASAILANEAVTLSNGDPVIVAGPWAKHSSPPVVDPSYFMPGVYSYLARATGDERWSKAASAAIALVHALTDSGQRLPSDWAQLSGSSLVATPAPSSSASIQYGLDAQRVPIWFGTSCEPAAVSLAADWWRNILSKDDRAVPIALSLGGQTINSATNPLPLLAAASAASAAGDQASANALRVKAVKTSLRTPTYYGDAWVALSAAITSGVLLSCKEVSNG
jgi:endoglucanase